MSEEIVLTENPSAEVIEDIKAYDIFTGLKAVFHQYHGINFGYPLPELIGFVVIGSVANGEHTEGESDLDVHLIFEDEESVQNAQGLRNFMGDARGFGYQRMAEITSPKLSHCDLLDVVDLESMDTWVDDPATVYFEIDPTVEDDPQPATEPDSSSEPEQATLF